MDLPDDLFNDDELIWHRQTLGLTGQIAHASLVERGRDLYGLSYVSDLVQRIGRRREHKTRVGTEYRSWPATMLNGIMAVALGRSNRRVLSPTADHVLRYTDPSREVGPELFERVYDRPISRLYTAVRRRGWWIIDVRRNESRIVVPGHRRMLVSRRPIVCICHDVERGLGHRELDPALAEELAQAGDAALAEMLRIEREADVRATYHVVGCLWPDVRGIIERDGHCIAFHSYDHAIASPQLARCRRVDYRARGYRPPQSKLTRELRDRSLVLHNFEWLACGAGSFGFELPRLEQGLAKIPIHLDDYELFTGSLDYDGWERRAMAEIAARPFVAICLHDCYARFWLPHFRELLRKVTAMAELRTLDQITDDLVLDASFPLDRPAARSGQRRVRRAFA
ncbi:MAG: hypothetical protein ACRELV_01995 [Longimicrobiales bacterium]